MLFTLEVLAAAEGDCLILHWGDRRMALIDGGPARTYEDRLKPRLLEIKKNRRLDTLILDLVMVSHIDNDHIIGINKLFSELRAEHEREEPESARPIRVERLWHNTFSDILGAPSVAALKSQIGQPGLSPRASASGPHTTDTEGLDLALILAGHGEGRALRDAHAYLEAARRIRPLNSPFKAASDSLITTQSVASPDNISGLTFTVVGPSRSEITKLKADFDKFITDKGLPVGASLAAFTATDNSPTNLSSLVCLVDYGGKRILLSGDARGDKIVKGLDEAGLLTDGVLNVDVLKVPHHGSARNVTADFFKAVRASAYVISADGKHGNPDHETLVWLLDSRVPEDKYELVFTYPIAVLDETRQRLKKTLWQPENDAIGHLLEDRKARGDAFTWSEGSRKLDLGDERVVW